MTLSSMEQIVGRHKAVFLTYVIIDQAGEVFEKYDMPIGYIHGANSELFEKIESALEGRRVGDSVDVELNPAEGFGEPDPSLIFTDDIANVPPEYRSLGALVEFENDAGEAMQFYVTKIVDGKLTIDANHPLAGQTVTFKVNIVAIRDATLDEIANGKPEPENTQSAARLH